jgi:hypothetical protein
MEKKPRTFHITRWPAMLQFEPDRLRAIIRGHLAAFSGDILKVAEAMGIQQRSVYGYMDRLEMTAEAKEARRALLDRMVTEAKGRAAERQQVRAEKERAEKPAREARWQESVKAAKARAEQRQKAKSRKD